MRPSVDDQSCCSPEVEGSGTPEQFAEIHADVMAQPPNRWHLANPVQLEPRLLVR